MHYSQAVKRFIEDNQPKNVAVDLTKLCQQFPQAEVTSGDGSSTILKLSDGKLYQNIGLPLEVGYRACPGTTHIRYTPYFLNEGSSRGSLDELKSAILQAFGIGDIEVATPQVMIDMPEAPWVWVTGDLGSTNMGTRTYFADEAVEIAESVVEEVKYRKQQAQS